MHRPPSVPVWHARAMMDDPDAAPAATLDKRKSLILGAVGVFFIVVIFWKVIPQIGSYSEAVDALQAMSVLALVLIVLAVVLYLATYGLPFMSVTRGLSYWESQRVNQAAFAISNGVPGGGAVGLAFQYGMLATAGIGGTAATASITAVGLWSTFVTLFMPVLGASAIVLAGEGTSYAGLAAAGLGILVGAVVVFVLVMRSERLARRVGALGNRLVNPLRPRISALRDIDLVEPIVRFRSDMADVLSRRWAAITAAQVAVSLTQFLVLFVALRGIQGWDQPGINPLLVLGAFAVAQIGLMIPITPGGLGTVDAFMISLLVGFGVDNGVATAATLVWRAASYVPQITIGIVALVSWYRRAGQAFAITTT